MRWVLRGATSPLSATRPLYEACKRAHGRELQALVNAKLAARQREFGSVRAHFKPDDYHARWIAWDYLELVSLPEVHDDLMRVPRAVREQLLLDLRTARALAIDKRYWDEAQNGWLSPVPRSPLAKRRGAFETPVG